jgi:hypothetical protein
MLARRYNAYRFLVQNVLRLEAESGQRFQPSQARLFCLLTLSTLSTHAAALKPLTLKPFSMHASKLLAPCILSRSSHMPAGSSDWINCP